IVYIFYPDVFVFFFFQEEDGIRYATVTGVQTCALPILDFHPRLTDGWKSTATSMAMTSSNTSERIRTGCSIKVGRTVRTITLESGLPLRWSRSRATRVPPIRRSPS